MNLLANSAISRRLAFGFSLMIALLIAVVIFSITRLNAMNGEIDRITGERMQRMDLIQSLLTDVNAFAQAAEAAVVATGDGGKTTLAPLMKSVKERGAALGAGDAAKTSFETSAEKIVGFVGQGDSAGALDEVLGNFSKVRQQYVEMLGKQRESELKQIAETRDDIARSYKTAVGVLTALSLSAIVIALIAGVLITRSVTVPLREVLRATEDLRAGEGDLTFRLPALKAEFGRVSASLNGFIKKLHDIIASVAIATQSVNIAAREIAAGNNDLSARTERQSETLQSTAANMEAIAATVKHNAANAQQARELAEQATRIAEKGGDVIGQAVRNMAQINDTSRRVADIVGVIDSIAFQTNILALNAAVEAARAGEQGRGFAVVAAEVRALAQRSATAAREIKQLIEASLATVGTGSRAVTEGGDTMNQVVSAIRSLSDLISQVSMASSEQAAGIERVNLSISSMEEGAQRNATLVQQAGAATASLEDQARALTEAVGAFKLQHNAEAMPSSTHRGEPPHIARAAEALRRDVSGLLR